MQKVVMLSALIVGAVAAHGQSSDAIINKLVEKGILTVDEARELRDEAEKGFDAAYKVKTGLPDWVTSLRIGGDFRARYDMIHSSEPAFVDRHRMRYRVRPGIVATIKDNFEVGFRLTSGEPQDNFGGDPISGNSTFQNNGSKKFVYIDLAYATWAAVHSDTWTVSFTVGKMENPFVYSDIVFDSDYTPEGLSQQLGFKLNDAQQISLNLGQFALDEISGSSRDPYLFGAQLRLDSTWSGRIRSSAGIGALLITSEQNLSETPAGTPTRVPVVDEAGNPVLDGAGNPVTRVIPGTPASSAVPNVQSGNTRNNGMLANNFNPYIVDAAVTYTLDSFPFYNGKFPIRFGAEYMNNPAADHQNEAYAFGITFGKSGRKGLWDISYRWRHLEADAWYEEMVDSDFGGLRPPGPSGRATFAAGTNLEGHTVKANYSPFDSLTIGVTYSLAEQISNTPAGFNEDASRVLLDAIWKF